MRSNLGRSSGGPVRSPAGSQASPVGTRLARSGRGGVSWSVTTSRVAMLHAAGPCNKVARNVFGRGLTRACSGAPAAVLVHCYRVVHHRAMPKCKGLAGVPLKRSVRLM